MTEQLTHQTLNMYCRLNTHTHTHTLDSDMAVMIRCIDEVRLKTALKNSLMLLEMSPFAFMPIVR